MAWTTKATSSGGGDFETCPAGAHPAVCCAIIDLGTQDENFQGVPKKARKIFIAWELPTEQKADGSNFVMGREYTYSFHEKAGLRKLIEAWRNKKFADGEDFDLSKLIGQACLLNVLNDTKNEKTYASINGASALPKGMPKPVGTIKPILFNLDDDDIADFPKEAWLPWSYGRQLSTIAALSPEWQEQAGGGKKPASVNKEPEMAGVGADSDGEAAPF